MRNRRSRRQRPDHRRPPPRLLPLLIQHRDDAPLNDRRLVRHHERVRSISHHPRPIVQPTPDRTSASCTRLLTTPRSTVVCTTPMAQGERVQASSENDNLWRGRGCRLDGRGGIAIRTGSSPLLRTRFPRNAGRLTPQVRCPSESEGRSASPIASGTRLGSSTPRESRRDRGSFFSGVFAPRTRPLLAPLARPQPFLEARG